MRYFKYTVYTYIYIYIYIYIYTYIYITLSVAPSGREVLIEKVLLSSMLNPGEQWQSFRHHGRSFTLEYRLRFRCDTNYYGPLCNKLCRARDDFFGHFNCDPSGTKVCKEGWIGAECRQGEWLQHTVFMYCVLQAVHAQI